MIIIDPKSCGSNIHGAGCEVIPICGVPMNVQAFERGVEYLDHMCNVMDPGV
jgi:hypothetical protein